MSARHAWCLAAVLPVLAAGAAEPEDTRVLLTAYFQYVISRQIPAQAEGLATDYPEGQQKQVSVAMADWQGRVMKTVRKELGDQFGDDARQRFETFVAAYTTAEKSADAAYLAELARTAGLATGPKDYAGLHRLVTTDWLKRDLDAGAAILGEVQTWLDVARRTPDAPPLSAWLTRGTQSWGPGATTPAKPARRNALRESEATAGDFTAAEGDAPSALDALAQNRKERRQRALEESQAGMQQVATERDAAEREYAARKTAAATAEAEAMKRHADKLAATEAEALEQRKDSWGNKLKGILSSTIGAATGAATGGIGTEAGRRLSQAIFDGH